MCPLGSPVAPAGSQSGGIWSPSGQICHPWGTRATPWVPQQVTKSPMWLPSGDVGPPKGPPRFWGAFGLLGLSATVFACVCAGHASFEQSSHPRLTNITLESALCFALSSSRRYTHITGCTVFTSSSYGADTKSFGPSNPIVDWGTSLNGHSCLESISRNNPPAS